MRLFKFFRKIDGQTLYFKSGQLYKIVGDQENWYDPKYIVSDRKRFDLSNAKNICRIPIPKFGVIDVMSGYGATGMLDYVLRMKAGNCFNRNEKELCSALLWKSTELMLANKYCAWKQSDYERLVDWHVRLGMSEEAEAAKKFLADQGMVIVDVKCANRPLTTRTICEKTKTNKASQKEKLTAKEKELLLVQRITTDDMKELGDMPFVWNCPVQKLIQDGTHPFAYMDIIGENLQVVKSELTKMNRRISQDLKDYPQIPSNARIPIENIVFEPSDLYGYTKIICTPKTLSGKIAKYPLTLFFATDLSKTATGGNTTHGELIYGQNGMVHKANIYCWRKGGGYFFRYQTIDGELTLYDIDTAGT